jgi:putative Mn2+ efflux pump MntP
MRAPDVGWGAGALDITFAVEVLGIAVALAMDAFTVSCGVGLILGESSGRQQFRLSWHFGFFQFLMPIVGWLVGYAIAGLVSAFGKWLAFVILLLLGLKMIWSAAKRTPISNAADPTKGISLIFLSLAVSIDALAVGFSLSLIEVGVFWPSVVIGIVTSMFTLAGLRLGRALAGRFERPAMLAGGLILIAIGIKILL